ncbi:MAG: NUDIX hydrolase [Alphaproteobacteria bacterium]
MSDDRSYPSRPMIGVGVVILRDADVLLIRRGKAPRKGEWSLPGGMQELGETAQAAAHREIMEETNVEISLGPVLDIIDIIRRDDDDRVETHYTLIDYAATWVSGVPVGGDDAMHAEFIPLANIGALGMWDETVRIIHEATEWHDQRKNL